MGGLLWNAAALSTFAGGTLTRVSSAEFPISTTMTGALGLRPLSRPVCASCIGINGTYESITLSAWMAGNPDLLLATNFGQPESVFAKFPKDAVVMPEQD